MNEQLDEDLAESETPWVIDGINSAEWAMRKLALAEKDKREIDEAAQEWHRQIDEWRKKELAVPERRIEFFSGHLERWALAEREANPDRKSWNLPSGSVKTRHSAAKVVVVDQTAVLEWARTAAPEVVVTKESVSLTALRDVVTMHELGIVMMGEAEIVPGVEVEDESFSVKVDPITTDLPMPSEGEAP